MQNDDKMKTSRASQTREKTSQKKISKKYEHISTEFLELVPPLFQIGRKQGGN